MPSITTIRDQAETIITATTPRYLSEILFTRAAGHAPLEELEGSVTSTHRQFEVRPGPVTARGDYDGACYELVQTLEVLVRYGIDRAAREVGYSSWRVVRGMAASDAADLINALEHRNGMATTWSGVAHNVAFESVELPEYPEEGAPVLLRLVLSAHYSLG